MNHHVEAIKRGPDDGGLFDAFSEALRSRFDAALATSGGKLFRVDVERHQLSDCFLSQLPEDQQQYHTCACCRSFLRHYGNLVTISDNGNIHSALWGSWQGVPEMYQQSVSLMAGVVQSARIREPFFSSEALWGTPRTGEWTHFHLSPTRDIIHRERGTTAPQKMALKRQQFGTLERTLTEFALRDVQQAVNLLRSDSLYNSEAVLGAGEFLLQLFTDVQGKHGRSRDNAIWRALHSAPPGWCTPRTGMIGTLLEDIQAGMPFERVQIRFAEKMHPLRRMRPQAAPAAGNIAMAEKLVKDLNLGPALQRRFARVNEVQKIWQPQNAQSRVRNNRAIFGGILAKGEDKSLMISRDVRDMTWVRFARDVLPTALEMDVQLTERMNLGSFVTAVDPLAEPILQWDHEGFRNPFSMYVYHGGSSPAEWGLSLAGSARVAGVALHPSLWEEEGKYPHFTKCACLILEGARDTRNHSSAIFPSTLKSDLHKVRSTIEAFSKKHRLTGLEEASAAGMWVGGGHFPHVIRVTTGLGSSHYHIDRWE